jgi:hypothetical protein
MTLNGHHVGPTGAEKHLNPIDVRASDDVGPFVDIGHDAGFELFAAGRPWIVPKRFEPLDRRGFPQNIGTSLFRRSAIDVGIPAGPASPCHEVTTYSGRAASEMVGTRGKLKNRVAPVTASGRSLSARTNSISCVGGSIMKSMRLPSRSVTTWVLPRYGTCCNWTFAILASSSIAR